MSKNCKTSQRMKQRHVTRESNIPKAKEALQLLARDAMELCDRISESGTRPPTDDEMALIRMAYSPILDEVLADLKAQFMATGYIDSYELHWFNEFDNNAF